MSTSSLPENGWLPSLHIGPRLAQWVLPAFVYTMAVGFTIAYLSLPKWDAGNEVAGTLSVVLGILVVFRNNTANDRWWEARKLWGQLINDSRNLALKAHAHVGAPLSEHRQLGTLLIGFCHALRCHLQDRPHAPLDRLSASAEECFVVNGSFPKLEHAPGRVAGMIHEMLARWNHEHQLENTVWLLDVHARALMDICGACERIRNTPLASSYRALMRWALAMYVLIAPWAVCLEIGLWGIAATTIAFLFMLGFELAAEAIEQPFGSDDDDLPLDRYCAAIERFVNGALGE